MGYCMPLFSMVCNAREKFNDFLKRGMWDIFYCNSTLWASCSLVFRGVSLSILQLKWLVVCDSPH